MAQQRHTCIYCGQQAQRSGEHRIGEWVQKYIDAPTLKNHTFRVTEVDPARIERDEVLVKSGGPYSIQVREVCIPCNTGWMRKLEEATEPILAPLLLNKPSIVQTDALVTIARWTTVNIMTSEHYDHQKKAKKVVISTQADRDWMMAGNPPPDNWRIWIGQCTEQSSIWRHGRAGYLENGDNPIHLDDQPPRTQVVVYTVGAVAFVAISSMDYRIPAAFRFPAQINRRLVRIWPRPERPMTWPRTFKSTPDELLFTAQYMQRTIDLALGGSTHF